MGDAETHSGRHERGGVIFHLVLLSCYCCLCCFFLLACYLPTCLCRKAYTRILGTKFVPMDGIMLTTDDFSLLAGKTMNFHDIGCLSM